MKFKYKILFHLFILCAMVSGVININSCLNLMKPHINYECFEETKYNSKSCNKSAVNWTPINSTLGLVEVEFDPCGNNEFDVTLYVREIEEKLCDSNGTWDKHSFYSYSRIQSLQNDLPKCSEMAKVQLEYIFTGCYKIEIGPKFRAPIPTIKYLQTKYVKFLIAEENMTAQDQPRYADNKTYLKTKFNYTLYSDIVQLCFHLDLKDSIEDTRLIWNVSCPVKNVESICWITVYGEKNVTCSLKKQETNELIINCNLFGLIPGNYLFEKYIVNEPIRCNIHEYTVWGRYDCHWIHNLNITEEILIKPNQIPENSSSIYLIGILALVIISLILITLYFLYKKIQLYKLIRNLPDIVYNPNADSSDDDQMEDPGVLLLYARDCKIFMETMSSFRRMLQTTGNQVFDIHDPRRYAEILTENQSNWLFKKITHKNIKIILVLSECGDYLHQEQKSYKSPHCFDSMYNYGVRILVENAFSFSCNKLFVTKFSYFDESSILSPNRRYNLDDFDNLRYLVSGLFNNTELRNIEEYVQFNERCNELITFVRDNPNYLVDILEIM